MKCMITALSALLAVLLMCGCGNAPLHPIDIDRQTPDVVESYALPTAIASAVDEELSGPEGIEAIEFADDYPEIECEVVQLGIVTEVSEESVTFDEVLWISGEDLPKDHAGDYELRPTGETVTLTVDEDSKFWILWHVHWIQPARISTADFLEYFNMSAKLVFNFYSTEGMLLMASEQYTA